MVENVGRGRAENIKFTSDRPIPCKAFGITKLNKPRQEFQSGVFKHGIKIFGGVLKSMLTLNEAIIDVKEGFVHDKKKITH